MDKRLVSAQGEKFPIRSGMPRFISDTTYADPFGVQWKRYRLAQLDSYTGTHISRDRARPCLGESLWELIGGAHVLEAGCGAGRFTEVLLERGACVSASDLTDAVEATSENSAAVENYRIAQADFLHAPFPASAFDVIFCLGVVQSTPSPEATLAALYTHVKPGGWFVFDHYTLTIGWLLSMAPLYRLALRKLPSGEVIRYTEAAVKYFLRLQRRAGMLRPSVKRLSPVMDYYDDRPELDHVLQREWAFVDTHDSLTNRYKYFRRCRGIERILEALGLENIYCVRAGNGVEARGQRPDPSHRYLVCHYSNVRSRPRHRQLNCGRNSRA